MFPTINRVTLPLLESRFHWLLSWYVTAVRFEGRRTGRTYTVPFNYRRLDEGTLEMLTGRTRRWWRNLRGGADVELLWKGRWRPAHAEVIEEVAPVAEAIRRRDLARRLSMDVPPEDGVVVRIRF